MIGKIGSLVLPPRQTRSRLPRDHARTECGAVGLLSRTRSNPMCDYSLHAMATRPAEVGETVVTTTFRGTSTRGFASEKDLSVAVCMLPGTELAFADDVKYDSRWIWTRSSNCRSPIPSAPTRGRRRRPKHRLRFRSTDLLC